MVMLDNEDANGIADEQRRDKAKSSLREKVQRLSDRLHVKGALFWMRRNQVRQFDKLVLQRRRHIVIIFLALDIVDLDVSLARTARTTSPTLGRSDGFLRHEWWIGFIHGDGRDRASLGVRDVEQVSNCFAFLLQFRSHVLGRCDTATRGQERL